MTPTTTTSSRLLALLTLLQTRRSWPGQVLADRLDVSHRTVRRDVERLRELGYRIQATMGPDGGYHLDAGSQLPPLLFDDEQAVALAIALRAAAVSGAGIEEAAARALTTVRQVLPSRLRHRLDAVRFTALPAGPHPAGSHPAESPPGSTTPDTLRALSGAVRAREVLRFDYPGRPPHDSDVGQPPPRRVEPHHLVTSNSRWYLVAWDLDRADWRIFRVDRIRPRTPTGPRFAPREIPGGSVRELVAARFKGSDQGNAWPCVGTVVLHLPASAVLPFTDGGTVEDLGPDRCGLEVGSWSWVALAAWLGRFDADVEVVGPVELREAFGTLAARCAATAAAQPSLPRPGRRATYRRSPSGPVHSTRTTPGTAESSTRDGSAQ